MKKLLNNVRRYLKKKEIRSFLAMALALYLLTQNIYEEEEAISKKENNSKVPKEILKNQIYKYDHAYRLP